MQYETKTHKIPQIYTSLKSLNLSTVVLWHFDTLRYVVTYGTLTT